jgi:hypothetical protein
MPKDGFQTTGRNLGIPVMVGLGTGAALGVALDDVAVGLALGIACGIAMTITFGRPRGKKSDGPR